MIIQRLRRDLPIELIDKIIMIQRPRYEYYWELYFIQENLRDSEERGIGWDHFHFIEMNKQSKLRHAFDMEERIRRFGNEY